MRKDNNTDVSMNSVFLETFRRRKNEILASDSGYDESGVVYGENASGNSVFLETFRRRKNKKLASELGINAKTKTQMDQAVSEKGRRSETSGSPIELVSRQSQRPLEDTSRFKDQDITEPMDDSTVSTADHSRERIGDETNKRQNSVKSTITRGERTGLPAEPASSAFRPASSASGFPTAKKDDSDAKNNKKDHTKKRTKIAIALSLMVVAICGGIALFKAAGNEVPIDEPFSFISPVDVKTESDGFHESAASTNLTTTTTTETTTTGTSDSTVSTTSSTPDAVWRAIEPGEDNDDVKKMQQRLAELGYFAPSSCTGYYGEYTKKRLKIFQNNAGLEPTGLADVETLKRLFADDAPRR